jgi:Xaa-Pro dipeptidase
VFPTGRRFTHKQEQIYQIVLACNKKGIELAKPGTKWEDVHMACLSVLLEGLRHIGIVKQGDFKEQFDLGIPSIFQPHGLGHILGLNTHDVGGYNKEIVKSTDKRLKYLRTRRTL